MSQNNELNNNLEPLNQWYCDSCGEMIETADDGWLEWYHERDEHFNNKGFRIVHHDSSCMYDTDVMFQQGKSTSDMHLNSFVGADGLVNLLSKIQYKSVKDEAELVEVIRRLHVPYYEEARKLHNEAERDGFFDGENELTRYLTETSKNIVKKYNS